MEDATRPCAHCGDEFVPVGRPGQSQTGTYCGRCCLEYREHERAGTIGEWHAARSVRCGCGNPLPKGFAKFCSEACRCPPTGAIVSCVVCGKSFRRSSKAESCSDACSLQLTRERYRRKNRKRRMAKRNGGDAGRYTLSEVAERDGRRCHLCGKSVNMRLSGMNPKGPTIDHLIPLSDDGRDEIGNVALAHRQCNTVRGAGGFAQLRLTG